MLNFKVRYMCKAVRIILAGQALCTLIVAMLAWVLINWQGFWSACLGGMVAIIGVLTYAAVGHKAMSRVLLPEKVLRIAIRAEAARLLVVIILLWLAFTAIPGLIAASFVFAFVLAVLSSVLGLAYNF